MSALQRAWYPERPPSFAERAAWLPASVLSFGFAAGVALKNALYDRGLLQPTRVAGAQVISVGNLNVGGAGKTPAVMWLARRFQSKGRRVAVLSRGYHRDSTGPLSFDAQSLPSWRDAGDEPLLIAQRCPGVRIYVGADRVERAHAAVADGFDLLLLDDGMQHRRLGRDRDVVVIDEGDGLGNGWMLPRGPLREPPGALHRASLVWLRASNRVGVLPNFAAPIVRARHAASALVGPDGETLPASSLCGRRVHALCALARPWSFTATLKALGADVVGTTFGRDHAPFTLPLLEDAARQAKQAGALLVTTEKDAVKLPRSYGVSVLRLEVELLCGEEHVDRLLAAPALPR